MRQGHRLLLYQMHVAAVRRALVNDRHVQHMTEADPVGRAVSITDTAILGRHAAVTRVARIHVRAEPHFNIFKPAGEWTAVLTAVDGSMHVYTSSRN